MEAKPPAALTSRVMPPTNHTPMIPKQAATTGYRLPSSNEEQLRLPVITHASPQRMKTPAETPDYGGGARSPRVIVAEPRPYAAAPTSRCKTRLHVSTGRREAKASTRRLQSHDEVQIRRLQQGSDNNAAAVARP